MLIDLIMLILALVCGPMMVYEVWYRRRVAAGDTLPALSEVLRAVAIAVAPWLELIGYGIKRLIAFNWTPTEDDKPRFLRRTPAPVARITIHDSDDDDEEPSEAPPADANGALAALCTDRTRGAVIRVLVLAGWEVGQIRAVLKGDNGTIGAEVATARAALGTAAPPARELIIRERPEGKLVERRVAMD